MDGVLADLEGYVKSLYGDLREINKPNWGDIGLNHGDLYSKLDLMPGATELWDYCSRHFDNVQILTALPRRCYMPDAINHKRDWIHKHFGEDVRVNFGPYAVDKQYWADGKNILVDDMRINIEQWNSRGGIGILHSKYTSLTLLELEQYV
jgi:hypothetical protein